MDVAVAYLAALSAADWDVLAGLLADGIELGGHPARGRSEALARLRLAREPWLTYAERATRRLGDGDAVAVETAFVGTTTDGRRVTQAAVLLLDVADGRIGRLAGWRRDVPVDVEAEALAREVLGRYFAAANAKDWEALAEVWHEDAVLLAMGGPPRHGRESIVRAYQRFLQPWAANDDQVTRMLVHGSTVTLDVHFTGTTRGGKTGEIDIVDVVELEDGKIRQLRFCVDVPAWRAMLDE